jgi:hypothetical protein
LEASLSEVEVCAASLRPECVLILDSGGPSIFLFRGFLGTTLHRAKAFEMAFLMRQERVAFMGRCEVVQVDQGDEPDEFWSLLIPSKRRAHKACRTLRSQCRNRRLRCRQAAAQPHRSEARAAQGTRRKRLERGSCLRP